MKKFFTILIMLSVVLLGVSGCARGYTDAEIATMRQKLLSFENSKDFALVLSKQIWLAEKEIDLDEYSYQGVKIDRLFGCDDECFYASTRTKEGKNYTIHLLRGYYNTLEMQEIGSIGNLKERYTSSCRLVYGKLYFYDNDKHYIYDIETGGYECIKYNHEFFWEENGNYSFKISNNHNDSTVNITNIQTGEVKQVSWKKDLDDFEEGLYIQQFDDKIKGAYSCFADMVEKNGICYLLGRIPLDPWGVHNQAVIFSYDFKLGTLSYYSSAPYVEYNYPDLIIINR